MLKLLHLTLLSTLVFAPTFALASDPIADAPPPASDEFTWSGMYIGGYASYGSSKYQGDITRQSIATSDAIEMRAIALSGGFVPYNAVRDTPGGNFDSDHSGDGFSGGGFVGYNYLAHNNLVAGVEADLSFGGYKAASGSTDRDSEFYGVAEDEIQMSGSLRARFGYAAGRFLPYVTAGLAVTSIESVNTVISGNDGTFSSTGTHLGYTLGAGVDYAFTDNWIVKGEYRFTDTGNSFSREWGSDLKAELQELRLGIAYKF